MFKYSDTGGRWGLGQVEGGIFRPGEKWERTSHYWEVRRTKDGVQYHHLGDDIGTPEGTHLLMPFDGHIIGSGKSEIYGNYIIVAFDGGGSMLLAHMKERSWMEKMFFRSKAGRRVKKGTFIGRTGNTGMSTGPHVHVQMSISNAMGAVFVTTTDPMQYLRVLDWRKAP